MDVSVVFLLLYVIESNKIVLLNPKDYEYGDKSETDIGGIIYVVF
jgi:hypothetical protein